MDIVESTFRDHPVHTLLTDCSTLLGSMDQSGLSDDAAAYIEAIRVIVDHASTRLLLQDYRLLPRPLLDNLETPVRELWNRLQISPTEMDVLAIYRDAASQIVQECGRLPIAISGSEAAFGAAVTEVVKREAKNAQARVRGTAATSASQISSDRDAITLQIQEFETAKKAALEELSDQSANAADAIGKALESLTTAQAAIASSSNDFQTETRNHLKQISDALSGLEARFQQAEAARAESAKKAADEASEAHASELNRAKGANQAVLDELAATNALANEVLENAGASSLADRWIKQAKGQMWERIVWTAVLAVAIAGSLIFGYGELSELTAPHGSSWRDAAIFYFPRLPLAVISITAIGFMIRQVSRLAVWEARDRRVANELTALPALIARLDEDKQRDLVQVVSDRYLPGTELRHDEPQHQPEDPLAAVSRGITAVVASLATAAAVLGLALIISLTR